MKIFSFTRDGLNLIPFEIEVSFMPGLPQIQIMGLPDQVIKESQLRVKSALQRQGFSFPKAQQILVNLKPSYIKKKSQGLDLAIACAYLFASGQVQPEQGLDKIYVYGELGLDGCVYQPEDFDLLDDYSQSYLLSGVSGKPNSQDYYVLKQLQDLHAPTFKKNTSCLNYFVRPEFKNIYLTQKMARLLQLIAVGEHSCLIAGPAGSGKSTLVDLLDAYLVSPSVQQAFEILKISQLFQQKVTWRPVVSPHHSTPKIAMVGGGTALVPGEITRAHHGVLILDELLEFGSGVKESLREPIEKGCIHVARRSKYYRFPANFLLLATTNLCPCGSMSPGQIMSCRYSLKKCQSYVEKLSGPLLDRFQVLSFSYDWGREREYYAPDLFESILNSQKFIVSSRPEQNSVNARLSVDELEGQLTKRAYQLLKLKSFKSQRRRQAVLRVSRTVADLEGSQEIKFHHIEESFELADQPFLDMEQVFN